MKVIFSLSALKFFLFLAFFAGQVGHKRGNTGNKVFQLPMQQCCAGDKLKKSVARITGP